MNEYLPNEREAVDAQRTIIVCLGGLAAGDYAAMTALQGLYIPTDTISQQLGTEDQAEIKMHDTVAMASLTVRSKGQETTLEALRQSLGFLLDVSEPSKIRIRGGNINSVRFAGPGHKVDERSGLPVMPADLADRAGQMLNDMIIDAHLQKAAQQKAESQTEPQPELQPLDIAA